MDLLARIFRIAFEMGGLLSIHFLDANDAAIVFVWRSPSGTPPHLIRKLDDLNRK